MPSWSDRKIPSPLRFWVPLLTSIVAVVVMVVIVLSYGQSQDVIEIDLDDRSEVPLVSDADGFGQADEESLRVAIAGVLSPGETLESYQDLLTYIGENMGRRIQLILRPTYAEVNDLIRGGRVDAAFVCSLAYVEGKQDFGMELLVAPQMNGDTVYYSYLIVPAGSSAMSLADLEGKSFAFTDPISNSGHLAPTYELHLLGDETTSFFEGHIYTYSHDNSIRAVADRLVDGAAVDSLVYDQMVADDPELASETRVIAHWGPYGIPPVVVNPALDPQLKLQLQELFLNVHRSDEGRAILKGLSIDQFVIVPDDIYASIREMKTQLGW